MSHLRRFLKKFVVFVDVDGTVIGCSHLTPIDLDFPHKWRQDCVENPGKKLRSRTFWVRLIAKLGFRVAFITARPTSMRRFTLNQLYSFMGNAPFRLSMRPEGEDSVARFKSRERFLYRDEGMIPLFTLGDERSDFWEGNTGIPIKVKTL